MERAIFCSHFPVEYEIQPPILPSNQEQNWAVVRAKMEKTLPIANGS
jgi:hypothetical protein